MIDPCTIRARGDPQATLHVPRQAAPIDRAVSPAALDGQRGAGADLFELPVGDWLEAPGKYMWEEYAKDWLNK
jgi:hypothetical protein